jgi:hypothetical protein
MRKSFHMLGSGFFSTLKIKLTAVFLVELAER